MTTAYIDSHAHLYFDRFDEDRDEVLARAREAGFRHIINVSIDLESCRAAIALATENPGFCYATIGLHPTETEISDDALESMVSTFTELQKQHRSSIVAVGEIGFDFYWDKATPERQELAFRRQLRLAEELSLPVIIHCRDAWPKTLEVVAEYADRVPGVFHCFGGTPEEATRAVELGWYVSFAGNVSFPKAQDLRDAAAVVPIDRLLLETDAPFLAAQPVRGKRNEPVYALHTAATLAEIHGRSVEELGARTTENAERLFPFGDASP
ncbi:MAG: TatD family hydrolase [Planctomycetota bacterium]